MANWFAPKRYGCGSGMPMSWQGWVAMLVYLALVIGGAMLAKRNALAGFSIIVPATALFLIISFRKTEGGWACRWGGRK